MNGPERNLVRATVLGAGVMGAQIAAHLANVGVQVDLLDVADPAAAAGGDASAVARTALNRLAGLRPAPLYAPEALRRIRPGNFADDLDRVRGADWVIEAVVEDLAVKRDLLGRVAARLGPETLVGTNTSGLGVGEIAAALPNAVRARFLGTHFFNPPRYLRLVELVPTPATAPEALALTRLWLERDLGKGTVIARDTPNFIANRIGGLALAATLRAMVEFGLSVEEVDALTGPVIGHPRSATFRTLDVVGLDTALRVADNLMARLADPDERAAFALPPFVHAMAERGLLGQKAGAGFYRRADAADHPGEGRRRYLVIDPATLEYREPGRVAVAGLERARAGTDAAERLRRLVGGDDVAAHFVWRALAPVLAYSARRAEEIAGGDLAAIDRAMRWGYGWELGPFETWAALGLRETAERLEREGETLPAFVEEAVAAGRRAFYDAPDAAAAAAGVHHLSGGGAAARVAWETPSATLWDIGDEVALLSLHPAKDAIGPELVETLHRAGREVERDWRGLVLAGASAERFLVGANLLLLLAAAQNGDFAQIEDAVTALQAVHLELKYLARPVVVAPAGLTLGGGAELALHADRIVAAAELYIGQVEAGAGLIPAGGGTKELLARALGALPPDLPWLPALAGAASPASVGAAAYVDPAPLVARVFQTVALARVSQSAAEARTLGFLRPTDEIVVDADRRVAAARETVVALDRRGYRPPDRLRLVAPGREVRALLDVAIDATRRSGLASEHDARIASELARVLCGGDVAMGSVVDEQRLLDLEREAFVRLCGEARTQARMEHLLRTGRPLRN